MAAVIAIDPGSEKCGVAVVAKEKGLILKKVVPTMEVSPMISECLKAYEIKAVLIGNGTGGKAVREKIESGVLAEGMQLILVDEYRTTDMAKRRYWLDNPPRGWRRLLPVSFQVPPVPVDDYAAVIMAERYLKKR